MPYNIDLEIRQKDLEKPGKVREFLGVFEWQPCAPYLKSCEDTKFFDSFARDILFSVLEYIEKAIF